MGVFRSFFRFVTTLGGLLSSKVDEGTDALVTTPAGIKAAFKTTREQWTKQYKEVRDAVAQLLYVMEQKRSEIRTLEKEQDELEAKKRGAVAKFKETRETKYQTAFENAHTRLTEVDSRLERLLTDVTGLENQVGRYKSKLTEMQKQIQDLDKQEAEAIADIVTNKQIVELNDRMANISTSLHDENINAIERTRQRLKATANLTDELAGTDAREIEREVLEAGMSDTAMDEFSRLLAESEMRDREQGEKGGPEMERQM